MTWTTDRYINLFTDFGFKRIFGEEMNKDLLIDFLNSLLADREVITDLHYLKSERLGRNAGERKAIFDLYCTNQQGEKFIVEIQRVKQEYFKDRTLYYASFAIQEQAQIGPDWHYQLKAVYSIAIMDFEFDDTRKEKLRHEVKLMDVDDKTVFYNKLSFIYLEVPKFDKALHELSSNYERWLFAFKSLHRLHDMPEQLQASIFAKLLRQAEIASMNEKERTVYEESLKDYRDLRSAMNTYFAEGEQEGLKKGLEQGLQKGLQKGLEKGIEKEKRNTIVKSHEKGLSIELIASITELPAERVIATLREAGLL